MKPRGKRQAGFTLIEMLVSIVILVVLMVIIFQIIQMTNVAYKQSSQGTGVMQQARVAFERMTRNISQATLNTYYGYYYPSGATSPPTTYMRQSELQLISGYTLAANTATSLVPPTTNVTQITHAVFFQAPLGVVSNTSTYGYLGNLLNSCGYFVAYTQDQTRPSFLGNAAVIGNTPTNEYRYRLMEYIKPSDYLNVYMAGAIAANTGNNLSNWIGSTKSGVPSLTGTIAAPVTVRPLANNIVALIIMPEVYTSGTSANGETNTTYVSSATSSYTYDSAYLTTPSGTPPTQNAWANQLPPLIKVIMVAIDEPSAIRLAAANPGATSVAPPAQLPNTYGATGSLFMDPSKLLTNTAGGVTEGDLEKFEDILNATPGNLTGNTIKLNYYVFQTDVVIRGAHWSK